MLKTRGYSRCGAVGMGQLGEVVKDAVLYIRYRLLLPSCSAGPYSHLPSVLRCQPTFRSRSSRCILLRCTMEARNSP